MGGAGVTVKYRRSEVVDRDPSNPKCITLRHPLHRREPYLMVQQFGGKLSANLHSTLTALSPGRLTAEEGDL